MYGGSLPDLVEHGIALVQTCGACPEQYDAYLEHTDIPVGYFRLRHGYYSVYYPDPAGDLVYEAHPQGDGIFEPQEREGYLRAGILAIRERIKGESHD